MKNLNKKNNTKPIRNYCLFYSTLVALFSHLCSMFVPQKSKVQFSSSVNEKKCKLYASD